MDEIVLIIFSDFNQSFDKIQDLKNLIKVKSAMGSQAVISSSECERKYSCCSGGPSSSIKNSSTIQKKYSTVSFFHI